MVTTISVIVATYGDDTWVQTRNDRALPSVQEQGADMIVVHHEPQGNRATSLNNAAKATDADWLLFLDADDEFAPEYEWAMRRALEQNTTDGTRVLFTPAVQKILKGRPGDPSFWDRGISLREDNWCVIGTMVSRELFNEVGGFNDYPHGFEDFALWSKCYRAGATVVKVPQAVYRYHWTPQSAHKRGWRDRKWQVATHQRVIADLDAWEAAR